MVTKVFRWALVLFLGSIVFSLAGYGALRLFPSLIVTFASVFSYLVQVPTWIYMGSLPVIVFTLYLAQAGKNKSILFLVWGSAIGLAAELTGTMTGFPFGTYEYTHLLGPKIMGHVPYLIPPSWYAMGLLSLDLAGRLGLNRIRRVLVGAVFMVLWDVSLDPAMSFVFQRFWFYPNGGEFFGMPLVNWVGWFGTSVIILYGFEKLGGLKPDGNIWAPRLWFLNAAFPLGITLISGFTWAFLAGVLATAIPFLAIRQHEFRFQRALKHPSP